MTKKEERHHDWSNQIANQNASGLTMTKWCTENGVSLERFKYWKSKLKKDLHTSSPSHTPRFVPLTLEDRPSPAPFRDSLVVRIGKSNSLRGLA